MCLRCPQGGVHLGRQQRLQDTFSGVSDRAPRLLRYYVRGYGRPTPLLWRGQRVGWSATGVKQGDPAGLLYFAVSTDPLFCSIRDTVDRVVGEYFPLMPSYTGVSAICDDLQVTSDPQLALQVSEVVQRKFMESGRSLNLKKCRILVHPDSAHLVVWPPGWRSGICAAIPIETDGAKLLGAPIGRHRAFSDRFRRAQSVKGYRFGCRPGTPTTLGYLDGASLLRVNYLAQVTEFPLVQDSLARMDTIIDQALLRAADLPPPSLPTP